MIKIYGHLPSRLFRCLWMLEEVGVRYEWVKVNFNDLRTTEFLQKNPNGRMPILEDDDGTIMWESMAINLHLAQKYGKTIFPSFTDDLAKILQWTFWSVAHTESHVVRLFEDRVLYPRKDQPPEHARSAELALAEPLSVLDRIFENRKFLIGERLSPADINVASILSSLILARVELRSKSHLWKWITMCLSRPYPSKFFSHYLR